MLSSMTWFLSTETNLPLGQSPELPWFQDLSALALQGSSQRRFDRGGEDWVRFAKKRRRGSHRLCFVGFRSRTPGPPPFSSSTPSASGRRFDGFRILAPSPSKVGSKRFDRGGEDWVRFAKNLASVSPPLLCRLPKPNAGSAAVLVDELDAAVPGWRGPRRLRSILPVAFVYTAYLQHFSGAHHDDR
jgi:hypothetical protein